MDGFPEKYRSLDVLETGQRLHLSSGVAGWTGKIVRLLSDGDSLTAFVACPACNGAGAKPLPGPASATVQRSFGGRDAHYSFVADVLEARDRGETLEILLSLPDWVDKTESRSDYRIRISIGGNVHFEKLTEEIISASLPFLTKDLSLGGVLTVCDDPIPPGALVRVEFDIPGALFPPLRAESVRCEALEDGQWLSGLKFIQMSPENRDTLYLHIKDWERGLAVLGRKRIPLAIKMLFP
jgi:hypothetical protein